MMTAAHIKRHIACIPDDRPFSTREFLAYGSRAAIDQTLWRLVQKGLIIRIARGLFIKHDSTMPSLTEIAKAKASAFGRTIVEHGLTAIHKLELHQYIDDKIQKSDQEKTVLYACNGRSSSFKCGDTTIKFIGTSPRKMNIESDRVGLVLRALWYFGKSKCTMEIASLASRTLNRLERKSLREMICFMPFWMPKCFASFTPKRLRDKQSSKSNRDFHPWFFQTAY